MKAFDVKRDEQGFWTHPQLPMWDEKTKLEDCKKWFASKGLDCDLVIMDGEMGELWCSGKIGSCLEWKPSIDIQGAFLVGIWDTEDGVVAMFAFPLVIFADSSKAARFEKNISGWVSRDGRFYGANEDLARWNGSTHRKCECGEVLVKNAYCQKCSDVKEKDNFLRMPVVEWDGSAQLYDQSTDKYFGEIDDIFTHYEDEGLNINDAMIVVCEPNYAREIESDFWCDELPQDLSFEECGGVDAETVELLEKLNKKLKHTILSYSPGKNRIDILASVKAA